MQGCTISDSWTYNDMRVAYLENHLLKVGVLIDRGSDIFEFRYKPKDLNLLLKLPKDILNPRQTNSQLRHTFNQMEDYYYGGWQECLPNSAPFNYRGAHLGQHGEVWMIPWKHAIVEDTSEQVSLRLWTTPLRLPLRIEKTLSLKKDQTTLSIQESLTNMCNTDLEIMWGHHIAFGLPFLTEGAIVETNAKNLSVESEMPEPRRYQAGQKSTWPQVILKDGRTGSADRIPAANIEPYSELAYLSGFNDQAYYSIVNREKDLGLRVDWDASLFKSLWYWQERFATEGAPWWGSAYAIGLEPWTNAYTSDPTAAIERGEFLKILAHQTIHTKLSATVLAGNVGNRDLK